MVAFATLQFQIYLIYQEDSDKQGEENKTFMEDTEDQQKLNITTLWL